MHDLKIKVNKNIVMESKQVMKMYYLGDTTIINFYSSHFILV